MSHISVAVTRSNGELSRLIPEWWDLWRRSPDAMPFQSPAWLVNWIREFAPERSIVLTARSEDRLVGLLPVQTDRGEAQLCGGSITDYHDAIIDPTASKAVGKSLLQELCRADLGFQAVRLSKLRANSPLIEISKDPGWTERSDEERDCRPVLQLPDRTSELGTVLPKRMSTQLRYYRRRATKTGPLDLQRAREHDAVECFEQLVALHTARWVERGRDGVLSDETVLRFHRAAIPDLARADLLRLYVLRLSGKPVAALYGLQRGDRFYYYIGGFDPAMRRFALGTLLIGHAIECAVQEGCKAFDFLSGSEAYKYHWGAIDERVRNQSLIFDRRR